MLTLKSKHRCQCYTESASFLYGLRRDAPSTERVRLERLLNVLSRAAAHKNKNPQRLWAESERPEWWKEVTKLPWKNPRELPKDNKEMLKKKIEVLLTQLRKRDMMTKELEEEVAIHRGSKKIDLELKSDFEAIISKASGLHFMLDKIHSKMWGQNPIISNKMASYVSETKSCIDKIYTRINYMYEQVQEREERRSDLWAAMGVSKHQRPAMSEESIDTFFPDPDLEVDLPNLYESLAGRFDPKPGPSQSPTSPSSTSVTLSPEPSHLSDSLVMQKLYTESSPQYAFKMPLGSYFQPISSVESSLESSISPRSGPSSSVTIKRSLSQSDSAQIDPELARAVDLSQGRSASLTRHYLPKRSWRQSVNERGVLAHTQTKVKSRRTQQSETSGDFIVIDEEEDSGKDFYEAMRSPASVASNPVTPTLVLKTSPGTDSKQTTEAEPTRLKAAPRHQRSPRSSQSESLSLFSGLGSPAPTATHGKQRVPPASSDLDPLPSTIMPSLRRTPDWQKRTETASRARANVSFAVGYIGDNSSSLSVDVVEDAGDDFEYSDIVEDSSTPSMSMYDPDTSGMDQLAEMTTALSCEDLRPSVTEKVMSGVLPASAHTSGQGSSATTASREKLHRPFETVRPWAPVTSIHVAKPTGVVAHRRMFQFMGSSAENRQQQSARHRPQTTAVVMPSQKETDDESLSRAIGGLRNEFLH